MPANIRKHISIFQHTDLLLLAGLVVAYVAFFVYPVFLNPERTMKFIPYVVKIDPIGLDLAQMLDYSRMWFLRKQSPYVGANPYPPLATVVFVPLLFVDATTAYHLMTLLTLVCYVVCVLVLPWLLNRRAERAPLLLMVFITGLFSYGLHFELERGQFNLLAVSCCLFALYLFHHHDRAKYLAYLLFCLAVQLKIYPAIFVLLFVKDSRDWRRNLTRIFGLLMVNVGLFFALGVGIFQDFFNALIRESGSNLWIGNHSIRSFVLLAPLPHKSIFQCLLLGIVVGCIGLIMIHSYRQRLTQFNAPLFFACTVAALLIPSVSNDYKLTLLTAAMSVAFPHHRRSILPVAKRVFSSLLLLVVAFAYASTLYSFTNKPLLFKNNLPALLTILCAWTILVCISSQRRSS
jgi:hypothetical protein